MQDVGGPHFQGQHPCSTRQRNTGMSMIPFVSWLNCHNLWHGPRSVYGAHNLAFDTRLDYDSIEGHGNEDA